MVFCRVRCKISFSIGAEPRINWRLLIGSWVILEVQLLWLWGCIGEIIYFYFYLHLQDHWWEHGRKCREQTSIELQWWLDHPCWQLYFHCYRRLFWSIFLWLCQILCVRPLPNNVDWHQSLLWGNSCFLEFTIFQFHNTIHWICVLILYPNILDALCSQLNPLLKGHSLQST